MKDPEVLDPDLPFQKSAHTFIEIIKSELIPAMLEYSVSRLIRGVNQRIILKPRELSSDPDFPDQKNFTIVWKCKKINEVWPESENEIPKPVFPKGSQVHGCFGYGPGKYSCS
ncbi:hypothetical protein SK128_013687 [Halocaridina rubra]|uniref:Uncharacterized protein n=1 Tax=Halocaridina rubra TaxID=373956 RepID=A0AAN9ACZ9_HALRR